MRGFPCTSLQCKAAIYALLSQVRTNVSAQLFHAAVCHIPLVRCGQQWWNIGSGILLLQFSDNIICTLCLVGGGCLERTCHFYE